MKIFDNMRGRAAIQGTADRFGQSPEEVRREIQAAIDAAWNSTDPAAQAFCTSLFPEKPTPEQFIIALAQLTKTYRDP